RALLMRSHWLAVPWVAVAMACNVPIERFTRADAAIMDDASQVDAANQMIDASSPAPFVPLHLMPDGLVSGAPDLALRMDQTVIDTTALTIDGQASPYLVRRDSYAVLFADALSIEGTVTITGTSPLIAVASGAITVAGRVDLGAVGSVSGPGAS